jgi:hypothetical protein
MVIPNLGDTTNRFRMLLVRDRMAIGSWATNELLNSGGPGAIFLDSTPNFFFKERF